MKMEEVGSAERSEDNGRTGELQQNSNLKEVYSSRARARTAGETSIASHYCKITGIMTWSVRSMKTPVTRSNQPRNLKTARGKIKEETRKRKGKKRRQGKSYERPLSARCCKSKCVTFT